MQACWAFEVGRGLTAPAGGSVTTVATDNDGRYLVDRLSDTPTARARVTSVTLVVYQRGYVAYRSDRVFDNALGGARARTDFCQHNNVVKLERWTRALSHVKHVRFVGGSGALKRALGNEVVEASLELTAGPRQVERAGRRSPRACRRSTRPCSCRSTSCAPSPATPATSSSRSWPICRRRRATTAATSRPPASPRPSTPPSACGS